MITSEFNYVLSKRSRAARPYIYRDLLPSAGALLNIQSIMRKAVVVVEEYQKENLKSANGKLGVSITVSRVYGRDETFSKVLHQDSSDRECKEEETHNQKDG